MHSLYAYNPACCSQSEARRSPRAAAMAAAAYAHGNGVPLSHAPQAPPEPDRSRTVAGGVVRALRRARELARREGGQLPPEPGRKTAVASGSRLSHVVAPPLDPHKTECPASHQLFWEAVREEAVEEAVRSQTKVRPSSLTPLLQHKEPFLASYLYSSVLSHGSLPACLASVLANKLGCPTLPATQLCQLFTEVYSANPQLVRACQADLQAVVERDPACAAYVQAILFFKGFQALQAHRLGHELWGSGRRPLAAALQNRVSEAFHVDIHPGASIGAGLMLDHATGVVIGETAVVGANCSFLHQVTLGGSGTGTGDRHPRLGDGVMVGAGVSLLGPVSIGSRVKVGAGSVVMQDIPDGCTAVGVPARVIARPTAESLDLEPALLMDQTIPDWYYVI